MRNADRNLWVDYLRPAVTVLVVAHHASLAYTTFAWFDKTAYIRSTHPVVDTNRWIGLDIFENFNDVFFMSLMFLIGGLFLTRSISKKGAALFIKDRFYRLFVPFLFLGTILMLIAYFPAYYLAHNNINVWAYLVDFFTVEKWPVGPPWFIWMLFVFILLFALLYHKVRRIIEKTGIKLAALKDKPFVFFYHPVRNNLAAIRAIGTQYRTRNMDRYWAIRLSAKQDISVFRLLCIGNCHREFQFQ